MRFAQNVGSDAGLGYQWDLDPGSRFRVARPDKTSSAPETGADITTPAPPSSGELPLIVSAIGWTAVLVAVLGMVAHVTHWNPRK
jgi:hypothetical protein